MISAVILAAGESKRMGNENKLLLPIEGEALIRRFVRSVCLSQVENVLVVLGFEANKIKKVLIDQPVDFVYNPFFMNGLTTSIKTGIRASPKKFDGYMICLSDLPFAKTRDFNILLRAYSSFRVKECALVTVPVFQGKRGNPVLFSSEFREEILEHEGEGCRDLIAKHNDDVREVIMKNGNLLCDIDSPEDYINNLFHIKSIK